MNPSTLRHLLIATAFLLVAAAVFGLLAMQVHMQGQELTVQLATIAEQRAQESAALRLERLAEETVDERSTLQSYYLASEGESIDFLTEMETVVAPALGLSLFTESLQRVTVGEEEESWIEILFQAEGSRTQLIKLLTVLETIPYRSRVTQVQLQSQSTADASLQVTLQIQLNPYES